MALINFPSSPTLYQTFTVGTKTWIWNGYAWDLQLASVVPAFTQANSAFIQANAAYAAANSASGAASAGTYANGAFVEANSAFITANAAFIQANAVFAQDNAAFIQANSAFGVANSGAIYANGAFIQANTATNNAAGASLYANGAFVEANASYTQANTATNNAAGASLYANGAFVQANAAYAYANTLVVGGSYANAAFIQANAAYTQANTATNNAAGASLYANGAFVQANAVYILANTTSASLANVSNSVNSSFAEANSAATYANGAFLQANSAFGVSNSASLYANGAFIQANAAYNYANTLVVGGSYANAAFIQANSAYTQANTATNNAAGASLYANGAFVQANAVYVLANTTSATLANVSNSVNSSFAEANSAALYANGAFLEANASFGVANSAAIYANGAFIQANAAYNYANTLVVGGSYANAAFVQANSAYNQANTATNNAAGASQYANSAYTQANTATNNAAGASLYANGGFIQSNSAFGVANSGALYANGAFTQANAAYAYANSLTTGGATDTFSRTQANSAFTQANAAYSQANSAATYANGAFVQSNAAFTAANVGQTFVNSGGTVGGSVTVSGQLNITGNLNVTGTATYTNTATLQSVDSLIELAANNTSNDVLDIGFYGASNTGTSVQYHGIIREGSGGTNPGTFYVFKNLATNPTGNTVSYASLTPASISTGNITIAGTGNGITFVDGTTQTTSSASAGLYANGAFIQANAAYAYANTLTNGTVSNANTANVALLLSVTNPNTGIYYVKFGSANTGQSQVSANANFTFNAGTDTLYVPTANVTGSIVPSFYSGSLLYTNSTTQYLITGAQTSSTYFGSGDFTIEAWVYLTSTPALNAGIASVNGDWQISWQTNGFCYMPDTSNRYVNTNGAAAMSTGAWYHVAFARQSGTVRSFLNGVLAASISNSTAFTSLNGIQIGSNRSNNVGFPGYITNVRINKGTAVYTNTFTPPTSPLTNVAGTVLLLNASTSATYITDSSGTFVLTNNGSVAYSANTPYTITYGQIPSTSTTTGALIVSGGVGVSGNVYANSVYDNGIELLSYANTIYGQTNAAFTQANAAFAAANAASGAASAGVYANGAFVQANAAYTQANTATNNAAGASLYANGAFIQANGAFGTANSGALYANGAFVQANSSYTQANTATNNAAGASLYANGAFIQANAAYAYANSLASGSIDNYARTTANAAFIQANAAFTAANAASSGSSSANYANIANAKQIVTQTTGTYYLELANTASGIANSSANTLLTFNAATGNLAAPYFVGSGAYLTGISASTATSANTANTANIANTLLVTNPTSGTYYVKFGSANTGQSQVSANANFTFNAATDTLSVPTANITGSSVLTSGGSLSFNGTSQYLTIPANSAFYLASGDFTVEAWVYVTASGRAIIVAQDQNTGSPYAGWTFFINATNQYRFEGTNGVGINSPSTVTLNAWTHVAAVRSGTTTTLYVNGTSVASGTVSITNYSGTLAIGQYSSVVAASYFPGYMTNLRIVQGTAVYTSNFTPQTTPLPRVANTTLLLDVLSPASYLTDSSSNNFTITNTGGVTYSANSPITPAYQQTPSISTTTGALIVSGGIGVSGNVYASNVYSSSVYDNGIELLTLANTISAQTNSAFAQANAAFTTANNALPNTGTLITHSGTAITLLPNTQISTSCTTGALIVTGGVGISGNVYAANVYTNGLYYAANGQPISTGGGGSSTITSSAPTISSGTLTLNLSAASVFNVAVSSAISTITISGAPSSPSVGSFVLIFTYNGTSYSVAWPTSFRWPSGVAPSLTFTNGKQDMFTFMTLDGGTTYQAVVSALNM